MSLKEAWHRLVIDVFKCIFTTEVANLLYLRNFSIKYKILVKPWDAFCVKRKELWVENAVVAFFMPPKLKSVRSLSSYILF
jgi:hypothetical protein